MKDDGVVTKVVALESVQDFVGVLVQVVAAIGVVIGAFMLALINYGAWWWVVVVVGFSTIIPLGLVARALMADWAFCLPSKRSGRHAE